MVGLRFKSSHMHFTNMDYLRKLGTPYASECLQKLLQNSAFEALQHRVRVLVLLKPYDTGLGHWSN